MGTAVSVGLRVKTRDGNAGRVTRLLRGGIDALFTHFVVRTRPLFGRELIVPVEWATRVSGESLFLDVGRKELDGLPIYRPDEQIAGDIQAALWEDDLLRRLDFPVLRAEVRNGIVTLRGHVVYRSHQARAEQAARSVRGVRDVRCELVADDELEARVAQALGGDPRTRPYYIQVHASHGIVHLVGTLQGTVPSAGIQSAAEEVAANVAGVRSAVGEMFAPGGSTEPLPIVARVGLPVFASDGEMGRLEAVVMGQRSRRVTHLVVADPLHPAEAREPTPGLGLARQLLRLIPASDVSYATEDAIFLLVDLAAASRLPEYLEGEYTFPGLEWGATFDYRREDVRFAAEAPSGLQLAPADAEPIAA